MLFLSLFIINFMCHLRRKKRVNILHFLKKSLEIIKAHSEIDYFQALENFYILLLKDSEFSFFNDCLEEVKTVLGNDVYSSLSFFKTAACYLETKDISILEKLNLEERKPVDLILKEIEKKKKKV